MEGKKRKREEDRPLTVVTFSAPENRTFDRVLRDQSFSEVKAVVRKKLGLEANAKLSLVQLRDGKEVDLEDEDDYDAFRALSRTIPNLHVAVRVDSGSSAWPQAANNNTAVQTTSKDARPIVIASVQPVALSRTLDTTNPEEEDGSAASPRRKKRKSSTGAAPPPSALAASAATETPAAPPLERRKKKHKTRGMSSGSAADLSSNIPEILASGTIHPPQKPSGSFVIDSTESSRIVSPEPIPATQLAEKVKKKKKAAVEKSNADHTLPTATEASIAEQLPKKQKRIAGTGDETDQPLAKKAKKRSKGTQPEQPAAAAPIPDASTSALPPPEQAEPTTKANKKSKKGKEPDTVISEMPVNGVSLSPAAAPAPAKAAKKKRSAAATVAAATASPIPPIDAEVPEKLTKSEKTKAQREADPVAVAGDKVHGADSTQDKTSSSNKEAVGPTEPEAKPKKSQRAKKEKPPKIHVVDIEDDIFAAISAVLGKNSADQDKGNQVLNHGAVLPDATVSEAPEPAGTVVSKEPASKKSSTTRKHSAKSRLSTSWGPADITDGSATSEASRGKEPTPDPEDTSISVAISRAHEKASAATPKAPAATASSATVDGPTVEETSASHASSAGQPARRISDVISAETQFSEVPIQGQDEGSSDDSDDENDEQEVEANTTLPLSHVKTPVSHFNSTSNSANLSEVDVEALLRGPMPRKSILSLLPSGSSSEEKLESEDDDNELASEEEEKQERAYRRMSKRFERHAPSSSDEEPMDDEEPAAVEEEEQPAALLNSAADELDTGDGPNSVESSAPVAAEEPNSGLPDLPPSSSADVEPAEEKAKPQQDVEMTSQSSPAYALEIAEDEVVLTSDPAEAAEAEAKSEGEQDEGREVEQPAEMPQSSQTVPEEDLVSEQEEDTSKPQEQYVEPDVDPATRHANRPAPASHSQENPEDPIEPSEGFDAPPDSEVEDPIELDEADVPERQTIPPASPVKPGQAKRMKDRNGRLPSEVPPASQPVRRSTRASNKQPEATGKRAETTPPAPVLEENAPLDTSQTAASARHSPRKSPQELSTQSSPSSPAPEPPVTKRRGRPPKSAEEKAMIAAEKEAEKKRKTEEKQAEKQRKAAEKKAAVEEKARLKAEKAVAAAKSKKGGSAKKTAVDEKAEDAEESEVGPASAQTTRPAASQPAPETASSAKAHLSASGALLAQWTPLNQASSVPDADTSMVDELRSSSPDAVLRTQPNGRHANEEQAEETKELQEQDPAQDSEDDTPTVKLPSRPSTQPLFAPSDSQYPDATLCHSSQPIPGSSPQSQPSSQSQGGFRRPIPLFKAQFRRLSDIASQEMFSPRSPLSSVPMPTQRRQTIATVEDRRASMYGDLASPDSDSSSDSEDEPISHIPKHRRAGVQKEMFVE